jgi:hypothetical protein
MLARFLADFLVTMHFLFIACVVFGGLLVFKKRWIAIFHVPSAFWAALLEINGWICPLTPLEQHFRKLAGSADYTGGFIDHYLAAIVYPEGLTRNMQIALGFMVIGANLAIYTVCLVKCVAAKTMR